MAQSNTGSDWNWFLIFIVFVVILAIALIVQARFSKQDAAEYDEYEETHHEDAEQPSAVTAQPKPEPEPELQAESETEPKIETKPTPETAVPDEPEDTPAPPETPVQPDDLKKLEGIGPKVASLLNENGITTFAQLADTPVKKLDEILDANKLQMMHPGSWPQQARLAADGDWEAFEKLQDELHGGRSK